MLRQLAFCPRIPWYALVLGLPAHPPPWTEQGLLAHDRRRDLLRRRSFIRLGLDNPRLHFACIMRSEGLELHGQDRKSVV